MPHWRSTSRRASTSSRSATSSTPDRPRPSATTTPSGAPTSATEPDLGTFVEIFLDRTFSGLTAGAIYVLVALALVVVFRSSGTINFAQGEFALFTCFIAWGLTTKGWPIIWAMVACTVVGFAMGVVAERWLIRPVAKR